MQMPSAGAAGLPFFGCPTGSHCPGPNNSLPPYIKGAPVAGPKTYSAAKVHRTLGTESPPLLGLIGYARPEGHARVDSHDEREYQLVYQKGIDTRMCLYVGPSHSLP